jgi:chitosanase
MRLSEILTIALVTGATAYNLPNSLKQIYDKHRVYCTRLKIFISLLIPLSFHL